MSDFSKAQVEDKVYSLRFGYGVINSLGVSYLTVRFIGLPDKSYYFDGIIRYFSNDGFRDITPDLYWDKPTIIEPEVPKRMITKTITKYINIYKDGRVQLYNNQKSATVLAQHHDIIASGVPVTGEYQIEE